MSDTYSLDIPDLVNSSSTDGEFTVLNYDLGVATSVAPGGAGETNPVYQPLVVSLGDSATPGTDALMADAAAGSVIQTLALDVTNSAGQVVDRIYLDNAVVVAAETADGGTTVAFDYQGISTTTFQPGANGAAGTTTTVGSNIPPGSGDSFAAPVLPAPSTTLPAGETLSLNVPGVTGPSGGDFTPTSYEFTVGPDGAAGPLVVDLGTSATSAGVENLLGLEHSGTSIPTLTLDVDKTLASGAVVTESIVLTNAVVTSYTDPDGDVSVSFGYSTATLSAYDTNPAGTQGTERTVSFNGADTAPAAAAITPDALGTDLILLSAPSVAETPFGLSGYSVGSTGTGHQAVDQPLVVTMTPSATIGEDQLSLDAANGTVIPTLTIQVTNPQAEVVEKITLTDAVVVEAAQAGGGSTFALDYEQMTTVTSSGTVTVSGADFAAPSPPPPPTTVNSKESLSLNLPAESGLPNGAELQPVGYQFTVGPSGAPGPLVVDLGSNVAAQGMTNLLALEQAGTTIPTLTLDIAKTLANGTVSTETIVLTNAVVTSYTNPAGDVSVSFNYSEAALTSSENSLGAAAAPQTVDFTGTETTPPAAAITPADAGGGDILVLTTPGAGGLALGLSGYSVGSSGAGGQAVDQPLVVTTQQFATTGENQLSLDAATGTVIPTLTLQVTNVQGQPVETITLTDAVVVEAAQAGGGSTFAFDYEKMTTTTSSGSVSVNGGTFAAPSLTPPSTTVPEPKDSLSLNVGVPGLSSVDFTPAGYDFTVGPDGKAGPLVVDLGTGAESLGVANLLGLEFSDTTIPTLTLDIQKTTLTGSPVTETLVLTDAVVTSYTNPAGDVSVSFDYAEASLTSYAENANGTLGAPTTVTFTGDVACYRRGTRIRMADGDTAIERLQVGDALMTASGALRTVRWLGWRTLDCRRYAEPRVIWPVRIAAGALAENLPQRDLWVSPGHSIAFDGVLIQAQQLINGATVVQEPQDRVEYWHVELDRHDLLLAEGLAAESYLDTGNRGAFANSGAFIEAFPDFRPKAWTETCIPLVTAGAPVVAARARLLERAKALGFEISAATDAHLVADGARIDPAELGPMRLAFLVPAGAACIELRCRTFVPAEMSTDSGDRRALGLCIGRLQLDGADVALDDEARFASGWHALEKHEDGHRQRWSRDRVPLPPGTRLVVLDIAGRSYYWQAPRQEDGVHALSHGAAG